MKEIKNKFEKTRNTITDELNLKQPTKKSVKNVEGRKNLTSQDKYNNYYTFDLDIPDNKKNSFTSIESSSNNSLMKFGRLKKNIFTIDLKKNIDQIDNQEEMNRKENLKIQEVQVKKLFQWENEKLRYQKQKLKDQNSNDFKTNSPNNELDTLNFMLNEKENFSKLNFKNNNQLQDIIKKNSAENCSIFLQNINLSKKKFNFDVFKNTINLTSDKSKHNNYKLLSPMIEQKDYLKQDINLIKQLKQYDIEIDGNLDALASVDSYRNIIREKIKVENGYKKDLTNLSQKLMEIKLEKKNLEKINAMSLREIEKSKRDYENFREIQESHKRELENKFKEICYSNLEETKINKNAIKKKSGSEDDLLIIRKEYQKQTEELDEEFRNYKTNFDINFQKLTDIVRKNKVVILMKEKEIKQNKFIFNNLIKEQKIYYLEILKKGIDVRSEGLIWLVRRLMELNTVLEYSMFPRFLDSNQIDYLLKLSYKQIEVNQLKTILKILKEKQKHIKDTDINEKQAIRTKTSGFSLNTVSNRNNNILLYTPNSTTSQFQKTVFSFKTMKAFDNIFNKYNFMIKQDYEHKIEDFQIQNILSDLKTKLKGYENDHTQEEYLNIDKRESEIFNDILGVRQNIQEIEKEIEKIRKDEMILFKRKYDSFKTNVKFNIHHDLIYAALFGNNIIV